MSENKEYSNGYDLGFHDSKTGVITFVGYESLSFQSGYMDGYFVSTLESANVN